MGVDFTTDLLIYTTIYRANIKAIPEDKDVCLYLKELMVENGYPYLILSGHGVDIFSELDEWEEKYSLNNREDLKRYYEEKFDTEEDAAVVIITRDAISIRSEKDENFGGFNISDLKVLNVNVEELLICHSARSYLW